MISPKWVATALVPVALIVGVIELSCVASERRSAPRAAPVSLFTDGPEPELPMGAEVDQTAPAAGPVVTR